MHVSLSFNWNFDRLSQKSVFFGVQWGGKTTSLVEEHKKTTWGKSRILKTFHFLYSRLLYSGQVSKCSVLTLKEFLVFCRYLFSVLRTDLVLSSCTRWQRPFERKKWTCFREHWNSSGLVLVHQYGNDLYCVTRSSFFTEYCILLEGVSLYASDNYQWCCHKQFN